MVKRNQLSISESIMKIAVLPGDGIGPEIVAEAVKVLDALKLDLQMESAPVGGAAYEAAGHPLPPATLKLAQESDAIACIAGDSAAMMYELQKVAVGIQDDANNRTRFVVLG